MGAGLAGENGEESELMRYVREQAEKDKQREVDRNKRNEEAELNNELAELLGAHSLKTEDEVKAMTVEIEEVKEHYYEHIEYVLA